MPTARRVALTLDIHLLAKNHTGVFAGVQKFADEAGWVAVIDNWPEEALARGKKGKPAYDGIVARIGPEHMDLGDMAASAGVGIMNVHYNSPTFSLLPGVFPDYHEIGRLQASHLLARGLRGFAFASIEGVRPDNVQLSGFSQAVEEAGLAVSHCALPDSWETSRGLFRHMQSSLEKWMKTWQPPVGVAACTDDVARFIAQLAHTHGWRVPQDVAIIGTRNEEHFCDSPRPGLSSVELGYDRVGYEAARLLESLMDEAHERRRGGKRRGSGQITAREEKEPEEDVRHILLPPVGVVARESTASYATADPIVAEAQAFIAAHCREPIEVTDVAAAILVSPKTLQNHFADAIGSTVAQEVRRARVEVAKQDLAETDLAIDAVAKRAGFTSNAWLCTVFREDVGVSPREYRRLRKVGRHG